MHATDRPSRPISDSVRRRRRAAARGVAVMLFGALAATALPSQCCISGISTLSYGQGCNPVSGTPPVITAGYNMRLHSVVVRIRDMTECCNTCSADRLLAIGSASANLPLPMVGAGCTLWTNPFVILMQPASCCCDSFGIPIPAGLQPTSLFTQGVLHFLPTASSAGGIALTAGLRVDLL